MMIDLLSLKDRDVFIGDKGFTRSSAIILPIVKIDKAYHFVFEKRANFLNTQPGEFCFPGGKIEINESSIQTAIRETCEELLVNDNQLDFLFPLDIIVSATSGIIHPFAFLLKDYSYTFNCDEVAEVFTIPISHFYNNSPRIEKVKGKVQMPHTFPFELIPNGIEYNWGYSDYRIRFYNYNDKIIWGITAYAIDNFIQICKKTSTSS